MYMYIPTQTQTKKRFKQKHPNAVAFCQDLLFQFRCHGQKQPLWGGLWEASHGRWFEDIPCSLDEPGPFLWSWLRWTVANQDALRGLAMKIWKSWWRRWTSGRSIRKISKAYSFHKSEVWQESILICGTCAPLREKRVNQPCGCVSNSEIPMPPLFFVEVLKILPGCLRSLLSNLSLCFFGSSSLSHAQPAFEQRLHTNELLWKGIHRHDVGDSILQVSDKKATENGKFVDFSTRDSRVWWFFTPVDN